MLFWYGPRMPDQLPVQRLRTSLDEAAPAPTLPAPAARPARLSVLVIEVLVDRIVAGDYPPGGLLPPEPVLCQSFDVSRSVVREALKLLEEKGLVTVRRGHGTVVTEAEDWNLMDPVVLAATVRHDEERVVIDDLVEVRAALEADMAARAATMCTPAELQQLHALVDELGAVLAEPARYLAVDIRFHDELMRISGNRLARAVVRAIHEQARSSAGYTDPYPEDLRVTHRGHVTILERIEAGDRDGAAEAMREHIVSMWRCRRRRGLGADAVAAR
jgi:DNA-binding FadR family transcriptional regulator